MNFIERDLEALNADILLARINGSRLGLYNYDERLVESPEIHLSSLLPTGDPIRVMAKNALVFFRTRERSQVGTYR